MPRKAAVKKQPVAKAKKTVRKRTVKPRSEKVLLEAVVPASPALTPLSHGHSLYYPDIQFTSKPRPEYRKKQTLIIGLGVSVIMTVIVIAWILNLKRIIGPEVEAASQQPVSTHSDLSDLKKELSDTLSEVKGQLSELKNINEDLPTSTVSPQTEEELRNAFKSTAEKTVTHTNSPTTTTQPSTLP